jgi:hypothetical protein
MSEAENPTGALSLEQAVEKLSKQRDEAVETEVDEGTGDGTPEEADGEAEGTEQDEDNSEAEVEAEEPEYEFDLPDGKKRLKKSEAEAAMLRMADYTRKTMELADNRKATEAEKAQTAQLKQQLSDALQEWAVPTEQEPDWEEALKTHKAEDVLAAKARWDKGQAKARQAREEWQKLQTQEIEETKAREWGKLLEAVPDWQDNTKFSADYDGMVTAGSKYGLTRDEIGKVLDHRLFLVLKDAAAYQKMKAGNPDVTKKVAAAQKTLAPGAKPVKRDADDVARRKQQAQRLKESGDIEDAVALLRLKRQAS